MELEPIVIRRNPSKHESVLRSGEPGGGQGNFSDLLNSDPPAMEWKRHADNLSEVGSNTDRSKRWVVEITNRKEWTCSDTGMWTM